MDNGLIDEQSEELRKYSWIKETVIGKKNGFLREHLKNRKKYFEGWKQKWCECFDWIRKQIFTKNPFCIDLSSLEKISENFMNKNANYQWVTARVIYLPS